MFHNRVYSYYCLCFWSAYSRMVRHGECLLLCRPAAIPHCHRRSWSRFPVHPCGQPTLAAQMCSLQKRIQKIYTLSIYNLQFSNCWALTPQAGEAIWLPYVPSRKNLRYHLFSRGLRLPSAYLKTSACLTNTNMQLGFPGTHYLTLCYMPRS